MENFTDNNFDGGNDKSEVVEDSWDLNDDITEVILLLKLFNSILYVWYIWNKFFVL